MRPRRILLQYQGLRSLSGHARRSKVMLRRTVEFMVVCSFWVLGAVAQATLPIVGVATGTSGAAIPGAEITVSNTQKGFVGELTTDTWEAHTAVKIPIGSYTVSAQA